MPVENRDLEPGTRLVATYKKETFHALVIAGEEGKVLYRLEDGREFKSPSSLGTAITSKACNGWMFWNVDTVAAPETESTAEAQAPISEPEDTRAETPVSTEDPEPEPTYVAAGEEFTEPGPTPSFRRVPNQQGVSEGEIRLYCAACHASFTTPTEQPAETCPEGHYPSEA